jgi:hypothetical protein
MDEQSYLGRHSFEHGTYRTIVDSPRSEAKLIRFAVPFQPGQSRTLRVSYKALAEVDELEKGRGYVSQIVHVRYILKTARFWKSFGPIELTVTMPGNGLVVMEPVPTGQRDLEGGRVTFTAKLENPESNFRLAWLPVGEDARCLLFRMVGRDDLADLDRLEPVVKHPQALRVLRALRAVADRPPENVPRTSYSILREANALMRAGFAPDEALRLGGDLDSGAGEARRMYNHVRELARVGWSDMDSVFRPENHFADAPRTGLPGWQPEDRRIAAEWIEQIPDEPQSAAARMARAYVELLGSPTTKSFSTFMDAARTDDTTRFVGLMLVSRFPDDPRAFAPLVKETLDKPLPATKPTQLDYNLRVAAKYALANGAIAPLEDALRILDKTDDAQLVNSSRIGEFYSREMGFDRVRGICDRIVKSGRAPDHWFRWLHQLDPSQAKEVVDGWEKHGADATTIKRLREQYLRTR